MKASTKTLLLWVVLILVFVGLFRVFSDPTAEPVAVPDCRPSLQSTVVHWAVPALLLIGVIAWFRWWTRKFHPLNEGVRLLNEGRALQALEVFEQSHAKNPTDPSHGFNIAVTQLQLWRLDAARRSFAAARVATGAGQGTVQAMLPEHEALVAALLGDVEGAQHALALTTASSATSRTQLARGIVAARQGKSIEARQFLTSHEVKQLGGNVGTLARTVDAFCIEALTGERRHVDRVGLFGEASPDELRRHWPELLAFIERAPAW